MNRSNPAGPFADLNVTPFIGVLLVMLAVFMTAAPRATRAVTLDQSPNDWFGEVPAAAHEPVWITVSPSGALFIGDTPSSAATLSADVCDALGGARCRGKTVSLRGNPDTRYGDFMAVMAILKASDFNVRLLNEDIE